MALRYRLLLQLDTRLFDNELLETLEISSPIIILGLITLAIKVLDRGKPLHTEPSP